MAKLYSFKDHPDHEKKLKEHNDPWIANAMSTAPMTEGDKDICRKAVKGLYEAANLTPPPEHRIVFVSSPFVMRFAGGFASAIWWMRDNLGFNPKKATDSATDSATVSATVSATDSATRSATDKKSWFKFDVQGMVHLADYFKVGVLGLQCAESMWKLWQGGNQWSGWDSFLTFFRYIAKLDLDYSKYDHWEKLARHSGPRLVHKEFCIISDRPRKLTVNARNQPHCETGPFCEWSDGSALFALNGVYVPQWVVETPANEITKEQITKETNADVRREIIRKIGAEQLLKVLSYKILDSMDEYELISFDIGDGRVRPHVRMVCPSTGLTHVEGARPEHTTAKAAWLYQHNETNAEEMEIVWQA